MRSVWPSSMCWEEMCGPLGHDILLDMIAAKGHFTSKKKKPEIEEEEGWKSKGNLERGGLYGLPFLTSNKTTYTKGLPHTHRQTQFLLEYHSFRS